MTHPASLTEEEIRGLLRIGQNPSNRDVANAQLRKALQWAAARIDDVEPTTCERDSVVDFLLRQADEV